MLDNFEHQMHLHHFCCKSIIQANTYLRLKGFKGEWRRAGTFKNPDSFFINIFEKLENYAKKYNLAVKFWLFWGNLMFISSSFYGKSEEDAGNYYSRAELLNIPSS